MQPRAELKSTCVITPLVSAYRLRHIASKIWEGLARQVELLLKLSARSSVYGVDLKLFFYG